MAESSTSRKFRFVWPLFITFVLLAFCGLMLQYVNYRVIKAVDDYENQRHHVSKSRPDSPFRTREKWFAIVQREQKAKNHAVGGGDLVNTTVFQAPGYQEVYRLLEPEVVQWKPPENIGDGRTWKGLKSPKKSRRRKPPLPNMEGLGSPQPLPQMFNSTSADLPTPPLTIRMPTAVAANMKVTARPSISSSPDPRTSTPSSEDVAVILKKSPVTTETKLKNLPTSPPSISTEPVVAKSATPMPAVWKSAHLLNISDFDWLMNNQTLCKLDTSDSIPPFLVVLVHTARVNFKSRQAIRHSWGSIPAYRKWQIRVAFLLGEAGPNQSESTLQDEQRKLEAEQENYGDLIMGSFIDSRRNLTFKHLMGLKWILNYCENANFILKVDDNIFIDITIWVDWLNSEVKGRKNKEDDEAKIALPDFYCKIKRDQKQKSEENSSVAPPTYCHRWAYGASIGTLKKLYSVSNKTKFFWKDDVFVTGVLKTLAKREYGWKPEIKDISSFVSPKKMAQQQKNLRTLCEQEDWRGQWPSYPILYLQRRDSLETDMICLWSKVLHDKLNKSKPRVKEDQEGKKAETTTKVNEIENYEDGR